MTFQYSGRGSSSLVDLALILKDLWNKLVLWTMEDWDQISYRVDICWPGISLVQGKNGF